MRKEIKKTITANAQGFIPSMRPAETITGSEISLTKSSMVFFSLQADSSRLSD